VAAQRPVLGRPLAAGQKGAEDRMKKDDIAQAALAAGFRKTDVELAFRYVDDRDNLWIKFAELITALHYDVKESEPHGH
jgi:hypothetical protein